MISHSGNNTKPTITDNNKDHSITVKALSPGEWAYISALAAVVIIAYVIADKLY